MPTYTPPSLSTLLEKASGLNEHHNADNSKRDEQTTLITSVASIISGQYQSSQNQQHYHDAMLGAYVFVNESIKNTYKLHSPEYAEGYAYNSGSKLYTHIKNNVLNSTKENPLTPKEKIIYLTELCELIESQETLDNKALLIKNIRFEIAKQIHHLNNDIMKIVNGVPTEASMLSHMQAFVDDYTGEKHQANQNSWFAKTTPGKEHLFLAQLVQAISHTSRTEVTATPPASGYARSHRILIGALLYIEKKIKQTHSMPSNSALYRQCRKVLNMGNHYNLSDEERINCLATFQNYINQADVRRKLEAYGASHFEGHNKLANMDVKLNHIAHHINRMTSELTSFIRHWPCTTFGATVGSVVGASSMWGVGAGVGALVANSTQFQPVNNMVTTGVSNTSTTILGSNSSARHFSPYFAGFIVYSTLTHTCATVFQLAGIVVGGGVGGVVGFGVDSAHHVFQGACQRYLNRYDGQAIPVEHADARLINALKKQPYDVFSEEMQQRICYALAPNETHQTAPTRAGANAATV